MTRLIKKLYVFIFARRSFHAFNFFLYNLSLRGLGILNYEDDKVSGEKAFIDHLTSNRLLDSGVILDIGANIGHYSVMLRKNNIAIPIYAFEPHPLTFKTLLTAAREHHFTPIQKGAGISNETATIYDYSSNEGSEHASIFKEVIEQIHKHSSKGTDIELTTIDTFVQENKIDRIALLKIDTEGNEQNALRGAVDSIRNGIIEVIQIEFNEMNVMSRTFMKDIVDLLPNYVIYRLLPDGMHELGNYNAVLFEIFAFQNIVAVKRGNR